MRVQHAAHPPVSPRLATTTHQHQVALHSGALHRHKGLGKRPPLLGLDCVERPVVATGRPRRAAMIAVHLPAKLTAKLTSATEYTLGGVEGGGRRRGSEEEDVFEGDAKASFQAEPSQSPSALCCCMPRPS